MNIDVCIYVNIKITILIHQLESNSQSNRAVRNTPIKQDELNLESNLMSRNRALGETTMLSDSTSPVVDNNGLVIESVYSHEHICRRPRPPKKT